jgi:hypothetical protein
MDDDTPSNLSARLTFRLTPVELAQVRKAAGKIGVSEYARRRITGMRIDAPSSSDKLSKTDEGMLREIRRIAALVKHEAHTADRPRVNAALDALTAFAQRIVRP